MLNGDMQRYVQRPKIVRNIVKRPLVTKDRSSQKRTKMSTETILRKALEFEGAKSIFKKHDEE